MGCANPEGATGCNIARQIALRAGCRSPSSGMTVNRFCSSGLQTIAHGRAAHHRRRGRRLRRRRRRVASRCVQNEMNKHMLRRRLAARAQAGDLLADAADRRDGGQALQHRARARRTSTACAASSAPRAAQAAGKFNDEIVPITTTMRRGRQGDRRLSHARKSRSRHDEGIRADTTYEGVSKIKPAIAGRRDRRRQRQPVLRRRRRLRA